MVTRRGVGFILPCAAAHFVWMLNAIKLNRLSAEFADDAFPVTWSYPATGNIVSINIHGAWRFDRIGTQFPVAVHPTFTHPRMSVQMSSLTVHGKDKTSLAQQAPHS